MLKKIRVDELRAEIASVQSLVEQARNENDDLGELQYTSRMRSLEAELETLQGTPESSAEVAIFFSGQNVYGAHGVDVQLAGSSLEAFQDLVSKQFAATESGQLGTRGPVALRGQSELMVSDVARGSFGFVLREVAEPQMVPSVLIDVVDKATDLVTSLASPDQDRFERAVGEIDQRVLAAARKLFVALDDAGAAIRIVEGERDETLSSPAVARARQRTEQMEIEERPDIALTGTLIGLLPIHRRFEFRLRDTGQIISGIVAREAARPFEREGQADFDSPVGKIWNASFRVREVRARNAQPRTYYTLLALRERVT